MFRFSLVLTLAVTQLLAGSGRAVYLCVSSDGMVCCVDSGPGFCRCCQHGDDTTPQGGEAGAESPAGCSATCCDHQHNESLDVAADETAPPALSGGPCSCDHELISPGQAARVLRSSAGGKFSLALQWTSATPAITDGIAPLGNQAHRRSASDGPPWLPDARLAMLSTIVIRC